MSIETIRNAMEKVATSIAQNPDRAVVKSVPAVASWRDGLSFVVTGPNGEKAETDMPKGIGGSGGVPAPGWLLRAALASCTGTVIAMRAAQLGVELNHLDVTVESQSDNRGMLGLDESVSARLFAFRTRVSIGAAKATPTELEAMARWGDAHSPVACTMREALGADIEVVVV